jgi:tetratricopeptide (TPR) repeat protein
MTRRGEVEKLIAHVQWGIDHDFCARDLAPMLERLIRRAPIESDAGTFARQTLAELSVAEQPWRAARLTRDLIAAERASAQTHGVLALAHSLLGNFRCAVQAYERALALAPDCVEYSHNLGHLLDVALERPRQALVHLGRAHRAEPDDVEIAASYAHALQHAGRTRDARRLLSRVVEPALADELLTRWAEAQVDGATELGDRVAPAALGA